MSGYDYENLRTRRSELDRDIRDHEVAAGLEAGSVSERLLVAVGVVARPPARVVRTARSMVGQLVKGFEQRRPRRAPSAVPAPDVAASSRALRPDSHGVD